MEKIKKGHQDLEDEDSNVLDIPIKKPVNSYNKKKKNERDAEHIEFYTD